MSFYKYVRAIYLGLTASVALLNDREEHCNEAIKQPNGTN